MFDVDELRQMCRQLLDVDARSGTDHDLLDATTALGELVSSAETAHAHLLAELDARGTTDRVHGMKTASWAASATGTARGPIVGRLKVGRALRNHFDVVDEAVSEGTLRFDHARALADVSNPRIVESLAAAQDQIVALADGATFEQWKRDIAALAEVADTDGVEPEPYEGNELRLPKTLDGRTDVTGTLDAANGMIVRRAIDAKADELFRRFTRDHDTTADLEVPGRSTLRALALVELLRTAAAAEPGSGSAPRAEVTIVVHNHETCDADGVPLPRAAAQVWGCDPEVWGVIVDKMGVPVDVGHAKRLATIAQRRAIAVRDGGCTFPGCDAPIDWCDLHHVDSWQNGGPTDLANLVALCRHHHGVTHRIGWTMTLDDAQIPHWITPTGDHLTGQRHHRPVARPPSGSSPLEAADPHPPAEANPIDERYSGRWNRAFGYAANVEHGGDRHRARAPAGATTQR